MSYKIIPNILTVLRILLVFPCAFALYYDYYYMAASVFMLAAVTDCFDGYLARKFGCQSKFGAMMDPIADKILIVVLFFILTLKLYLPWWFSYIVILREIILLSGAFFYRIVFGPVIFVPTMLSKVNTFLLLLLLFLTFCKALGLLNYIIYIDYFIDYLIDILIIITLFTSIYSGFDYIWQWSVRVYQAIFLINNK